MVLDTPKGSKQPVPETQELQDNSLSQLLGVTMAATKDLMPIDLAKGILGTIANIVIIAQSVFKNKSDFQAIAHKCETIRETPESATKEATEDDLRRHLGHALSQLNSDIASKKEQGFWRRIFTVTIDRNKIASSHSSISKRSLVKFIKKDLELRKCS
jgi:hypothetical protein